MSQFSEYKKNINNKCDDSNVIHLGFNISVAGNPASDFEIYVNDKKQSCSPSSETNLLQIMPSGDSLENKKIESTSNLKELPAGNLSAFEEWTKNEFEIDEKKSLISSLDENKEIIRMSRNEDLSIVNEMENVLDNFEKFSAHLREIPRLFTNKKYTSTPYRGGNNSRSEGNLSTCGFKPRAYIPRYDFRDGKYFKKSKYQSNDVFLKPLPGEGYFKKRPIRQYNIESYRHYTSVDSLSNCYELENESVDKDKQVIKSENKISDTLFLADTDYFKEPKVSEVLRKKEGNEVVDKQSSSSESAKDIKIYQSGGIIIMQNFNDMDLLDKKNLGESSKSVESENRVKEKKEDSFHSSDDSQKLLLNNSSDEVKGQTGKSVQFDLSSCENTRSKSCDSWSEIQKNEPIRYVNSGSPCKTKDTALLASQNQEFTSLSMQENDSIISNILGMSPSSSTSGKKLEWDSGADVGYLNLDISKENLSTIERIILRGLNSNEKLEKNLNTSNFSKEPSETIFEEININEIDSSLKKTNLSDNNITNKEKESVSVEKVEAKCDAPNLKKKERLENLITKSIIEDGISDTKTTVKTLKTTPKNTKDLGSAFSNIKDEKEQKNISSIDRKKTEIDYTLSTSSLLEMEKIYPQAVSDKSTYVNTLFEYLELPPKNISKSEESDISESSDRHKTVQTTSPRMKKLKKRKEKCFQGVNLTSRMKDKINTIIDIAKYSKKPDNKSKVFYQKNEGKIVKKAKPKSEKEALTDDEKNRHEAKTKLILEENINKKEPTSRKSQRMSDSEFLRENFVQVPELPSSSIQTETRDDKIIKNSESMSIAKTFSDQTVQTTEMKYESKCILAFESLRCSAASSQVGDKESATNKSREMKDLDKVEITGENRENKLIWSCSKCIQVPVINSSLPKHLAHPKEIAFPEQQNTKSTQFFGSAVTSLPNFHCATAAKEVETAKEKVLKNKSNFVSQKNRTQQENYKNSVLKKMLTNYEKNRESEVENIDHVDDNFNLKSFDECDDYHKISHEEAEKRKTDPEDKENFSENKKIEELTDDSLRQSYCSNTFFKENTSKRNGSKKSDSLIFGSCDVQLSDDGKKMVLTSELLKEHGDVIDRNIIQEKYFQSQLLEYDRRDAITKNTFKTKMEFERNAPADFSLKKEVSCQYSPHFTKVDKDDSQKKRERKGKRRKGSVKEWQPQEEKFSDEISRDNSQLKISENLTSDKDLVLTDSLSSSIQTAHSWVPGIQRNSKNQDFIVGRALSFEYLPGHLYEEHKLFPEKSFSESEQNMNSGGSFQSNQTHSSPHLDNPIEESESRKTICLESSDSILQNSDQIKTLDNNLTELEMVVSRLHEKDMLFQKITNSMLQSVTKKEVPEMSCHSEAKNVNAIETKEVSCEVKFIEESDISNNSKPEIQEKRQSLNDISTACQTDTMKSESNKFYNERKHLEQKVNEEKEQQIKWIENEISHLNMLRSLLEKHEDLESMVRRKKRHHYLTESNQEISVVDTLRENILRTILTDSLPRIPASADNPVLKKGLIFKGKSLDLSENSALGKVKELSKVPDSDSNCGHFGMSLSLSRTKNMPLVTTFPVGVHVHLRDLKIKKNRSSSRASSNSPLKLSEHCFGSDRSSETEQNNAVKDVGTSYHSFNDDLNDVPYVSTIKHSEVLCKCVKCRENHCSCLQTENYMRNNSSLNVAENNGESETNLTKPVEINSLTNSEGSNESNIQEIDKSIFKEISAGESFKSNVMNSKESSKHEQSQLSSDTSNNFEKCQCNCHAEPLPRCDSCNLLNTCKKCQCYKRIKCCLCKKNVPICSIKKTCVDVAPTSICTVNIRDCDCQMYRHSNFETQVCATCSCHMKSTTSNHHRRSTICICKKRYEERSSQTEKKACTCCNCKNPSISNSDNYQETKYISEKKQRTENQKLLSEDKCITEIKQKTEEKFPYQIKVPFENRNSAEAKNSNQIKNQIEKRYPSAFQTSEIKKFDQKIPCCCKNRRGSEKDVDDQPRNYFLQIEETSEISSEPNDDKDSIKVITITVPIRKVCKEDKRQRSSHQRNSRMGGRDTNNEDISGRSYSQERLTQSNQCNCCSECKGHRPTALSERSKSAVENYILDNGQILNRKKYPMSFKDEGRKECNCYENNIENQRLNSPNFQPTNSFCQENFSDDEFVRKDFGCRPEILSARSALDVEDNCNLNEDRTYHNHNNYGESTRNQYQSKMGKKEFSDECTCCHCMKSNEKDKFTHYPSASTSLQQCSQKTEVSEKENISNVAYSQKSPDKLTLTCKDQYTGIDQVKLKEKQEGQIGKDRTDVKKCSNEEKTIEPKSPPKISPANRPCRFHAGLKLKNIKNAHAYKTKDIEYHNFNKREYMTKSELEREEKKKGPKRLTLQECLTVKRPDLYARAECRRRIIQEKSRERAERHFKRIECLNKIISQCNIPENNTDLKLFTTAQMKKQTKKFYKRLPEVTNKLAEEKKKAEFRTNKIIAEIFAKKLQLQTLKGCMNLSNSFSVLSTI